jgi:hypothetical protein
VFPIAAVSFSLNGRGYSICFFFFGFLFFQASTMINNYKQIKQESKDLNIIDRPRSPTALWIGAHIFHRSYDFQA